MPAPRSSGVNRRLPTVYLLATETPLPDRKRISRQIHQVKTSSTQNGKRNWRRISTVVILIGLSLLIVWTVIRGPGTAHAIQTAASIEKRHRPEYVPGEALVRFKKDRAFEGMQQLAVPQA